MPSIYIRRVPPFFPFLSPEYIFHSNPILLLPPHADIYRGSGQKAGCTSFRGFYCQELKKKPRTFSTATVPCGTHDQSTHQGLPCHFLSIETTSIPPPHFSYSHPHTLPLPPPPGEICVFPSRSFLVELISATWFYCHQSQFDARARIVATPDAESALCCGIRTLVIPRGWDG